VKAVETGFMGDSRLNTVDRGRCTILHGECAIGLHHQENFFFSLQIGRSPKPVGPVQHEANSEDCATNAVQWSYFDQSWMPRLSIRIP